MDQHAELMRKILDEINGIAQEKEEAKPTTTPPNTVGIGVMLSEALTPITDKGLRSALLSDMKRILELAKAGRSYEDDISDELGDHFNRVKRSPDRRLKLAYKIMREMHEKYDDPTEAVPEIEQAIKLITDDTVDETELNKPMRPDEHPYPSFMHELVVKHPEIRNFIKIFPYKDNSGWLIKPKDGTEIDSTTFKTIRDACLEKGCKIVKTKDGNLDVEKLKPLPVEDNGELWKLSVSDITEPENVLQTMHDLEDLIGKPVAKDGNRNQWEFIWEFPNEQEAKEAEHLVKLKHPQYELIVSEDHDEVH